jgi:uncharacterized protein YndB with AHSA1/START domain
MLRAIAIAILALVVALVLYVATRPDSFRVQRTATIAAPAERIYPLIADFHAWPRWSPWEQIDPALQRTYGGPASGRGATYAWRGNQDVGSGRMEIIDETPPSRVVIKLDFVEPFEAHNTAELTLQPDGGGSAVTWAMYGPNTTLGKIMGLFFDMDSMVGQQFEKGLENLKKQVE